MTERQNSLGRSYPANISSRVEYSRAYTGGAPFRASLLYYKPMMIVNDNSRVVNKLEASLTDDARVIIYDRHMFIVQATGLTCKYHRSGKPI